MFSRHFTKYIICRVYSAVDKCHYEIRNINHTDRFVLIYIYKQLFTKVYKSFFFSSCALMIEAYLSCSYNNRFLKKTSSPEYYRGVYCHVLQLSLGHRASNTRMFQLASETRDRIIHANCNCKTQLFVWKPRGLLHKSFATAIILFSRRKIVSAANFAARQLHKRLPQIFVTQI